MTNAIARRESLSGSAPLDLDKAGVIAGFVAGLAAALALAPHVGDVSVPVGVVVVAALTWAGLKGAHALARWVGHSD